MKVSKDKAFLVVTLVHLAEGCSAPEKGILLHRRSREVVQV